MAVPKYLRPWNDGGPYYDITNLGAPVAVPLTWTVSGMWTVIKAVRKGTAKNLFARVNQDPQAGENVTFTFYVNGSPTALTATIFDNATEASDLVHGVPVTKGDDLELVYILSAGATLPRQLAVELELA